MVCVELNTHCNLPRLDSLDDSIIIKKIVLTIGQPYSAFIERAEGAEARVSRISREASRPPKKTIGCLPGVSMK